MAPTIDHDTHYPHRISCVRPFIHSPVHPSTGDVTGRDTHTRGSDVIAHGDPDRVSRYPITGKCWRTAISYVLDNQLINLPRSRSINQSIKTFI